MAHMITSTDHIMTVREPAWHGIGTVLPELATAKEAIEAARLGWGVNKTPVMYYPTINDQTVPDAQVTMNRNYVTYRTDNGQSLGIVGESYEPLQNSDAFAFMDAVTQDPGGPKYVTAGSLRGGLKVWVLCKLPSFIQVTDKDIVEEYLLLSNTHDGSRRVEVLYTPVRVVCQNTLTMALSRGKNQFRFKHVGDHMAKVGKAQDILGIARENHTLLSEAIGAMTAFEPTDEQVNDVLKKLITPPSGKDETKQTLAVHEMIAKAFREDETNTMPGVKDTAWGLYNSITEYADYGRNARPTVNADIAGERLLSNWYGKASILKANALDVVMDLVTAK